MPADWRIMLKNRAFFLGLFLFAIYILTASGHTYSPDEESIIYVTQSFVTRGDFNIPNPNDYPVVGGHRGVGGKIYSGTGIAPSLLSLPFYVIGGQLADALPARWHPLILRLFLLNLFNAFISALTGIFLYAWLRRIGASVRVSIGIVLLLAFGTMTWVYARTFYSESLLTLCFVLASYAVRLFHDTRAQRWMIVAGFACGLAALTKLQGLLFVPALGVYYVALELPPLIQEWRTSHRLPTAYWQSFLIPGLYFALALAFGLGLEGYLNWLRFNDPFQAGYGAAPDSFPILQGVYGLLLSSGKSVFLYAPPVLLGLLAFPRFLRERMAEAVFCVVLILVFVLYHAQILYWSGDGAWGPRYLVATLPFWLLPFAVAARDWWNGRLRRAVVLLLVVAGLGVNVLGLTINFDSYIQIQPVERLRHFNPADSPLLGQWSLLHDRVDAWWNGLVVAHNSVTPVRGFLATGSDEVFPRYLAPRASVLVKSDLKQPMQMVLEALDYRSDNKPKRELTFLSGGISLQSQRLPTNDPGVLNYRVQIPAELAGWTPIDIITLGSERVGKGPMGDELGVHLQSLAVVRGEDELEMPRYLAISPAPLGDPKALWGWYFAPDLVQFDFFPWYLYFSGLDDGAIVALIVLFLLPALLLIAMSAPPLARVLSRSEKMISSRAGQESDRLESRTGSAHAGQV